ncbi:urea transporter 2-like [Lineus longissimus]|uniref:urea transporter 2-like n=1 Tax=Lineus longissimus TaxID=88925 RepID=UPI002B4C8DA5
MSHPGSDQEMAPSHASGSRSEKIGSLRPSNPFLKYVMGDINVLNDWLTDKPWIVQMPNWIFRGIGAPIFLNNPISGLIIMVAMFISNAWVAINGLLGLVTAILTALALKQNRGDIQSGGCTFHGMLIGIVIAATVKPMWYPWVIFETLGLGIISVYVASGLGTLFGKFNLPALNLPFNLVIFIFLAAVGTNNPHFDTSPPAANVTSLNWGQIWLAIPNSMGQIYGSMHIASGFLILLAMLVASPITCLHAILGSTISIFAAISIAAPPQQIYDGVWAFNAVLTCASLGGFFYVISIHSFFVALFAAFFSTYVFGAMAKMMAVFHLPAVAFAFNLTTTIFLSVSTSSPSLVRVPMNEITYAELHWKVNRNTKVTDISN